MPRFCIDCKGELFDETDNSGKYFCRVHGAIAKSRTTERSEGNNVKADL